jgi:hypothetical protein
MGLSLRISLLLLVAGLFCDNTAHAFHQDDRLLQQDDCGATLGTVTADQLRQVGRRYIDSLLTAANQDQDLLDPTFGVLFQTVVNDVQVMKMCGSCESVNFDFFQEDRLFPSYHFNYCDSEATLWNSTHSSLVLLPIDPTTGQVFDFVRLRTFVSLTESRLAFNTAPTLTDLVGTMEEATAAPVFGAPALSEDVLFSFLTDYLPGMMAASSGSVTIFPDQTGYGESRAFQNRTTFYPYGYQQAAVVAYFATEYYLKNTTLGCTLLDKAIQVQGNGDGGFAAPFVGDAFRRFGIQILNVYAAGPPLDLESFLVDSLAALDLGDTDSPVRDEQFILAAFSYSAETPGYINTGTGQTLLAPEVREPIVAALSSVRQGQLSAALPDNLADIITPDLLELFRNASEFQMESRPCDDSSLDAELCQQIVFGSAWRVLTGEVARLNIPIELCYSPQDSWLSARQFPDEIFQDTVDVSTFRGPIGLEDLAPFGDHEQSLRLCSLSPMLFYTLEGHRPTAVEDWGNYMPVLDEAESAVCLASRPVPTASPTIASPTTSPSIPTTTEPTLTPTVTPPDSAVAKSQYTLAAALVGAFALMLVL